LYIDNKLKEIEQNFENIAKQEINNLGIEYENIIFTSLDVDTVVAPKYFSCLTYY
jgi:hypothetical protein